VGAGSSQLRGPTESSHGRTGAGGAGTEVATKPSGGRRGGETRREGTDLRSGRKRRLMRTSPLRLSTKKAEMAMAVVRERAGERDAGVDEARRRVGEGQAFCAAGARVGAAAGSPRVPLARLADSARGRGGARRGRVATRLRPLALAHLAPLSLLRARTVQQSWPTSLLSSHSAPTRSVPVPPRHLASSLLVLIAQRFDLSPSLPRPRPTPSKSLSPPCTAC